MSTRGARLQTLQQRLGFSDEDLLTSRHDEIVFWVVENLPAILRGLLEWEDQWSPQVIAARSEEAHGAVQNDLATQLGMLKWEQERILNSPDESWREKDILKLKSVVAQLAAWQPPAELPKKTLRIGAPVLEQVIADGKYTIGFIDVAVKAFPASLAIGPFYDDYDGRGKRCGERGHALTLTLPSWTAQTDEDLWLFEAKSTIRSCGELIRQIRLYQKYQKGQYVVVAPDAKFAPMLQAQGISFVEYPTGQVTCA